MNPLHGIKALARQTAQLIERVRNLDPNLAIGLAELKLDWYRIRNAADSGGSADTTEIFIYDEIGGWFGMLVEDFVRDLQGVTTANIDVRINSPGGSLFDSIAIYNALVKHPATVTTYVDALAASGASIIAMAGTECVMMVGSQLMIHDAMGIEMGNAANMRDMADFLDKQSDNIATIYAAKAGGEPKDWRALMVAETWMFAAEAVEAGLADRIYSPSDAPEPTPMEDPEPDPSDPNEPTEPPSEEPPDEGGQPADDELEDLMRQLHPVANRYKYAGRNRAPAPSIKLDNVVSILQNTLGKVRRG